MGRGRLPHLENAICPDCDPGLVLIYDEFKSLSKEKLLSAVRGEAPGTFPLKLAVSGSPLNERGGKKGVSLYTT